MKLIVIECFILHLENLKILSLGRNLIKNISGLEAVSDTLEQLWISYNLIERLKGITVLSKLKVQHLCIPVTLKAVFYAIGNSIKKLINDVVT